MYTEEHLYSIALRKCNLIGDLSFHKLMKVHSSAKTVWESPKSTLAKIGGLGNKIINDIGNTEHLKFAENELKFCEKNNIQIQLRHHNELPYLLYQCDDAPAILYQKGTFEQSKKCISIVGTRKMSTYGKKFIEDFFSLVAKESFYSVSGLALGIDKEVHEQSILHNIPTIAVLAHGFHTLYPSQNRRLADKILENNGMLFTEFNSSQKPNRENFIQRNRIVAGLSSDLIVVETPYAGGSMSTANFANGYNREVYALPGKISDFNSQGCNLLIAQNKASCISTLSELIQQLQFSKGLEKVGELFPKSKDLVLPSHLQPLFDEIYQQPMISLDELAVKTNLAAHKLLPLLLELELLGGIKSNSGRQFSVI